MYYRDNSGNAVNYVRYKTHHDNQGYYSFLKIAYKAPLLSASVLFSTWVTLQHWRTSLFFSKKKKKNYLKVDYHCLGFLMHQHRTLVSAYV